MMDQRQRNSEGRNQQFWFLVLPGHLDLPIVGGDVLTLERSLTRGTVRQAGGDICRREDSLKSIRSLTRSQCRVSRRVGVMLSDFFTGALRHSSPTVEGGGVRQRSGIKYCYSNPRDWQ